MIKQVCILVRKCYDGKYLPIGEFDRFLYNEGFKSNIIKCDWKEVTYNNIQYKYTIKVSSKELNKFLELLQKIKIENSKYWDIGWK